VVSAFPSGMINLMKVFASTGCVLNTELFSSQGNHAFETVTTYLGQTDAVVLLLLQHTISQDLVKLVIICKLYITGKMQSNQL